MDTQRTTGALEVLTLLLVIFTALMYLENKKK